MTPLRLLSLWRERWGKEFPESWKQPYRNDGLCAWGDRASNSILGSLPGLGLFSGVLFAVLAFVLVGVKFSLTNQYWLSAFILIISLFVRLYRGTISTLILLGFAMVTTARYLYWRFDSSLGPAFELDFFIALIVWCIEVYGVLLFWMILLNGLWPIKQITYALPENQAQWPKVTIFICATGHSEDDVMRSLSALQLTDWPPAKLSLAIIDNEERSHLQSTLFSMNVGYLPSPFVADQGIAQQLNREMTNADSELAVILSAGQTPEPNFLKEISGWFVEDARLGLVATPNHFLLPEPAPRLLDQLAGHPPSAEVMITRVSHFLKAGGVPLDALSAQSHIAKKLQAIGFGHAYLLQEADTFYRIIEPFAYQAFSMKIWVAHTCHVLGFYQPLLRYGLLTLPLLYLLANQLPMRASPELWSAYALPHLAQMYLVFGRTNSNRRWPTWLELREGILATYLLILTFFTALWTLLRTWKSSRVQPTASSDINAFRLSKSNWLMLWLHTGAIAAGFVELQQIDRAQLSTVSFYLVWSFIVVLLLVGKFAVFKEATEVAQQKVRLGVMSGMIRLPNNRTITCQTRNFPALQLDLDISATLSVKCGQRLKLSIFYAMEEFALDAVVVKTEASSLTVEVDPAWRRLYTRFSEALFARGPNWPNWLPGQHVDKIIPQWLIQAFAWPVRLLTEWVHRFSRKPAAKAADSSRMK
ncbi:cellulose synthase catalytic subunit [UDP-forming] [Rhodoferax lithotrophicus]|uniref:Cellulose synthase catalytic subunit [UDP-forming] n=1 Tax=Rhodoferax lithotrophicus TaxID=2798804 RepID=A0ABM7MH62_9BURK|nr:hypothetical protein [Rhodoferax sp. MIZ03]BCO25530.1 cellulose synthase catalytic subunit [UDP-forming] [Rhodoferax sp. MIZ03]